MDKDPFSEVSQPTVDAKQGIQTSYLAIYRVFIELHLYATSPFGSRCRSSVVSEELTRY